MAMNDIRTAGEQRYYDFIGERIKSIRTMMIVWMSILCLALISLFNNVMLAVIFAVIGGSLAVKNVKDQKKLKAKLDIVSDKSEFFRQLADAELIKTADGRVLIAKDYVLVYSTDVFIYLVDDMKRVEVKNGGRDLKTLIFVDKEGKAHEIFSCKKNERDVKKFERIYFALIQRIAV